MRQVTPLAVKAAVNRVPQVGLGFAASLNPYRGCAHGCAYCYARDTHAYLGLDPLEGFSRDLKVKRGVEAALIRELRRRPPSGVVAIGTATDPYQSLEGRWRLTRRLITLLLEAGQAFTLTTKSPLVTRDLDLLTAAAREGRVAVHVSLISLDGELIRRLEPATPLPAARLAAVERLAQAGVPVGLMAAPLMPFLTDDAGALGVLMRAAREAGAGWAYLGPLRLPGAARTATLQALARHWPRLVPAYEGLYPPGQPNLPWPVRQSLVARAEAARREAGLAAHGPRLCSSPRPTQVALY